MKIKISELNPNPFKKEINKGMLSEDTIKKIMSNMDDLGLMGSLPVFKSDNKYYLVAGHHRIEALKRKFGKDFEVEVQVHNYSREQVLRGMVIENFTQKDNDADEIIDNLLMIRKHLRTGKPSDGYPVRPRNEKGQIKGQIGHEPGSAPDIAKWIDNNSGDVIQLSTIKDYLSIADSLDEDLKKRVKKTHGMTDNEKSTSIAKRVGAVLSTIEDKSVQVALANELQRTDLDAINKEQLVRDFKSAPSSVKKKILSGEIPLVDVKIAKMKEEMEEIQKKKDTEKGNKITIKTFENYKRQVENAIGRTNNELKNTLALILSLENSNILLEIDVDSNMLKESGLKAKYYSEVLESL